LGGGYEIVCADDSFDSNRNNVQQEPSNYQRARVLCSYDAKDQTELNLINNEVSIKLHCKFIKFILNVQSFQQVIFVAECNPYNPDYMHGKQGLLKGLVPRAFLEILED
jgi:endophilin-B1